jgi:hypothetical protein
MTSDRHFLYRVLPPRQLLPTSRAALRLGISFQSAHYQAIFHELESLLRLARDLQLFVETEQRPARRSAALLISVGRRAMSVAGILASSLFSDVGSEFAQKSPSAANLKSGAQQTFSAVQQQLSAPGSIASGTSFPAQLTQLGQDLKSGNLAAAQADFSALRIAFPQSPSSQLRHHQAGRASSESGSSSASPSGMFTQSSADSDAMTAAMQAYSSLQQNPIDSALGSSLMAPASTFGIDA